VLDPEETGPMLRPIGFLSGFSRDALSNGLGEVVWSSLLVEKRGAGTVLEETNRGSLKWL